MLVGVIDGLKDVEEGNESEEDVSFPLPALSFELGRDVDSGSSDALEVVSGADGVIGDDEKAVEVDSPFPFPPLSSELDGASDGDEDGAGEEEVVEGSRLLLPPS